MRYHCHPTSLTMASAARSLRLASRSSRNQRPAQSLGAKVFVAWKSASSGGGAVKESAVKLDEGPKASAYDHWEVEAKEMDRIYRYMEGSKLARSLVDDGDEEHAEIASKMSWAECVDDEVAIKKQKYMHELAKPFVRPGAPKRDSFWDEDEQDSDLITNNDNDEFDENDMTDIAHAKLEEHREAREYARIAIWEMPLLASELRPWCMGSTAQA